MSLKQLSQHQGLLPRRKGSVRDFELAVEGAKLEVRRRYIGDQRRKNGALPPLSGEYFGACRLRLSAIFSPEVEVPDHP